MNSGGRVEGEGRKRKGKVDEEKGGKGGRMVEGEWWRESGGGRVVEGEGEGEVGKERGRECWVGSNEVST